MIKVLVKGWGLDYNASAPEEIRLQSWGEKSGRGSARLERTVRVREVPSSNLGAPTFAHRCPHGYSFSGIRGDKGSRGLKNKVNYSPHGL